MMLCLMMMISLLFIRDVTAEEQDVEFDSLYYSNKNEIQPVKIIQSSKEYNVSSLYSVNILGSSFQQSSSKLTKVKCELFISFNAQDAGIYTCQDDDNQYFLIPSGNVNKFQIRYIDWRIACEDLIKYIIEGEELTIRCKVKQLRKLYNNYQMTIGWIQGKYYITKLYQLNKDTQTVSFNHTFRGYQWGDGIFFYCMGRNFPNHLYCSTLLLKVYPQLTVKINKLHERCFKCQAATCGSGEKRYTWMLNQKNLSNYHGNERCFNNLTAGDYVVKCLVTTTVQSSSDEMEFTVKDAEINILTITMISTIVILLIVVTILIYLLKRKSGNPPQLAGSNQRNSTIMNSVSTTNVPPTVHADGVYHTIKDTATSAETNYIYNRDQNTDEDNNSREEVSKKDAKVPHYYFTLEK